MMIDRDGSDAEAKRIYAQGLELIREGDERLTEAFKAPQADEETLLQLLLLQRQAIAKQREGLALIDFATEMRYEALKRRQQASNNGHARSASSTSSLDHYAQDH